MRFIKWPYRSIPSLVRLLLVIAIVLGVKSTLRADAIGYPLHLQSHLQTDVIKNALGESKDFNTDNSFHKTHHIRPRYKTVKDSFRKPAEPSVAFHTDIECFNDKATDISVTAVLKPGYYLFLFRLNPF